MNKHPKFTIISTSVILFSVIGNIFMPVSAATNAVDNTNSITLQNSAAVPSVKASDYAAAQVAKEKSEASVKSDYEAKKVEFAKANKISVATLNDELSGKTKNPKYLDLFYTFVNTKKIQVVKDRIAVLQKQQSLKGFSKANSEELNDLQNAFKTNLTLNKNSAYSLSVSSFSYGPVRVQPFNSYYDQRINTLGTTQVSTSACRNLGAILPAPYEPGDILETSDGANLYIGNTGHAALIVGYSQVAESPGPGQNSKINSMTGWCYKKVRTTVGYVIGANKSRAVQVATTWMQNRPYPAINQVLDWAARDWSGSNLWDISTVYCSKFVWRVYADQSKILDTYRNMGIVLPIDLFLDNDTIFNYSWASK